MTDMPEGVSQITKAADYAAVQSDRWLFIAALIVLGFVVAYVARWFVKQYEGLVTDFRQDRHKYEETLLRLTQEQGAMTREVAVVLDRTTKVVEACNEELHILRLQQEQRRMGSAAMISNQ
jgi:hypothetical protein